MNENENMNTMANNALESETAEISAANEKAEMTDETENPFVSEMPEETAPAVPDCENAGDGIPEEVMSDGEDAQAVESSLDYGDSPRSLSDGEKRAVLANPMFLTFAKGKSQPLDELISDFSYMMSVGGAEPKISKAAKVTPSAGMIGAEYALSERQRRIARDAGMSYREYYNYLKTMKS